MKINHRLVIAFFLLLLVPLLFSHVAAYRIGSTMLADRAQHQVESVVAMQKERVTMMMAHNLERLALVLSRTQLRQSLKAFLTSSSHEHLERITNIIADARASINSFESISITALDGKVIASTDAGLIGSDQSGQQWFARAVQGPTGDYLFLDRKEQLKILLSGPLLHEGKVLGVLFITAGADDLLAITGDYSGLGATGETLLARKYSTGLVQIITPLRFDAAASLVRTYPEDDLTHPIVQAVAGKAALVPWGRDYRGRDVIAATAFIPDPGWGLEVKIDRDEALAPVSRLQLFLACVLFLSLALTSAVSWWLSQTITKPLVSLMDAAEKIGEGNMSIPVAMVESSDEIGQLSKRFEDMRQKLGRTLEALREQTARHQMSEARYRELVDNIDSGVAIYNYLADKKEFVMIDVNKAGMKIYGQGDRERLLGRSVAALYQDAVESGLIETFQRVYSTKTAELHAPYPFLTDQSVQWLQHFLYGLPSGELVVVMVDLTAQKATEKEKVRLERQNWQLQKNASLHSMAGAIAHHFNNYLGAVVGYLDMILEDWQKQPPAREHIVQALQAANKAAALSGQMLTYLGKSVGQRKVIDLVKTCREPLQLLQATAPKNVVIRVEFPDSGLFITANTQHIQQVLASMVTNAWEAMPEERHDEIVVILGTIAATEMPIINRFPAGWQPRGHEYAFIKITDRGTGIANEDFEKLFDPFYSTKFTGRGLGLATALGIVTAHAGAIAVESQMNNGSTFSVFLPL